MLLVVLAYLNDFRTSWLRSRRTGRPVVVGVQLIVLVRGGGIAVLVVRTPTSSATPRAARAALGVILLPRQPVILKWVVRRSVICVSNQVLVDSYDCVNLMLVSAVDGVGGYGSLQGGSGASSAADTLAAVAVVKVIVFVLGRR